MATKQLILWCGDGDGGSGGARIIDAATGAQLRDSPRFHATTDSTEGFAEYQNYFYLVDSDSSLVCYDKDNVYQTRVDLGYNDDPGEAIWTTAAGVHVLKKNKTFNTFNPLTNNLHKLMTYAHGTLAEVSAVVLDSGPALGDAASNTSYLYSVDRVYAADATGFWTSSNNSTVFTSGEGLVKVGYNGAVLDTWEPATVQNFNIVQAATGQWLSFDQSDAYALMAWRTLDFATKTIGATVGPVNLNPTFSAAALNGQGSLNNFYKQDYQVAIEADGSMTIPINWGNGDVAGSPAFNGQGKGAGVAIFNVTTAGAMTCLSISTLPYYDNYKADPANPRFSNNVRGVRRLSATEWVVADNYGVWKINQATGAVVWNFQWLDAVQQAYSGDGEVFSLLKLVNWEAYSLSGTVTDAAGADARKVRVHDQQNGEVVTTATTDVNGLYTAEVFSSKPKYVVCASVDDTKNFGINAHVVPA